MNPLAATGVVYRAEGSKPTPLGSCFLFRDPGFVLTASHCVRDVDAASINVYFPMASQDAPVSRVASHPNADLAVLMVSGLAVEPFWGAVGNYSLGEDFFAYGFPEDNVAGAGGIDARLFKGHFQRFLEYQSPTAHRCR
jgi:S1-C subfamily serine protease